jgi:transposase
MPQNFIQAGREQVFLMPPNMRDWLPDDHLALFVVDAVGVMNLASFYRAYRADGHGRAAYEPSVIVALVLYCWARGVRSARRIERACVEDVACRVIVAQQRPDHATIARFIVRHERALQGLFGEVLALCAEAGLASVGVIAIEGTKIAANANRDRTVDYEQIAREIVEEAIATDNAENEQFGERRGDELGPDVPVGEGRRDWLRRAAQKLERERAQRAAPVPRSRAKRLVDAKQRLEEELAVECAANTEYEAFRARGFDKTGRRLHHTNSKPYTPPASPAGKVNLTDPDSRLVRGMRGWVQGYNAQAVCNEQHLILAAEVTNASGDFGQLGPMLAAAREELAAAGITATPGLVLADAGFWHIEQMNEITANGTPVLIPPDSTRRKGQARPGWNAGAYDFMRSVLATPLGKELYKQRAQLIEPFFGDTKHNRGFTRFARRGRSAAQTEWRLIAATHNLLKLHKHFQALPA